MRNISWTQREADFLNKYLLLTSKPMIYLLNLSKEDYLANKIPNQQALQEAITFNGKYPANIIPYSVQYEETLSQGQPS